jgi:cation diffusion facilitator CzcD-associated flavoprotein CzcO
MPDDVPVIVVGAGPSGLSTAGALAWLGIRATVLERDAEIGARWTERYDRLRLHTIRRFSGLAHHPLPRELPRYVAKDDFARYLRDYAERFELDVRLATDVSRIRRDADDWVVEAPAAAVRAPVVVVATGKHDVPVVPEWPGRETFRGSLVHSSRYRSGADYAGHDVLVAGFGNTGAEIAADLVESGTHRVAVSVRTSPPIQRRDVLGIPIQLLGMAASVLPPRAADGIASALRRIAIGDLSRYGLGPAEWGPFTAKRPPIIDVGFLRQLRARRVEILPAVERLTEHEVVFADGRSEPFDAVVAATGFRNTLTDLVEFDGEPARAPAGGAPWGPGLPRGLYVIGLRETVRGDLFETRRDSLALAREISHALASQR